MTEPTSPLGDEPAPSEAQPAYQGPQAYPPAPYPPAPHRGQPYPGQPYPGQPYPGAPGFPTQPTPTYWQPGTDGAAPGEAPVNKKHRTGLIVSLVLVVILILCGGVATTAYVVSTRQNGTGQASPADAANAFLTAIYLHQSATDAEKYVCQQADDATAISKQVDDIKAQMDKLQNPTYAWDDLAVTKQTKTEATVTTRLRIDTVDEKSASQQISLITVNDHGWWVCDVSTGGA
jgi:flagellar basal body-associated protein FliL